MNLDTSDNSENEKVIFCDVLLKNQHNLQKAQTKDLKIFRDRSRIYLKSKKLKKRKNRSLMRKYRTKLLPKLAISRNSGASSKDKLNKFVDLPAYGKEDSFENSNLLSKITTEPHTLMSSK